MTRRGSRVNSILAVVGVLALTSGCVAAGAAPSPDAGSPVASTPSASLPAATTSAAGSSPSAAAGGTWQAGRYSVSYDMSSVIDLLPDGTAYLTEQPFFTYRDEYQVSGDTVTFAGESCGGVTGTYHWSSNG